MTIRSVLLACAVVASAARGGTAQDLPTDKPYAFFSPLPSLDAGKVPAVGAERAVSLGLRPNVEQLAYVFVYNPTDEDATVNVVLSAGTKAGGELARTAAPVTVASKQVAKVALAGKAAPAPVAVAVVPPADKVIVAAEPTGVKLLDPTLVLRVEKAEKADKPTPPKDYEKAVVTVNPPRRPVFDAKVQRTREGTLAVVVSFTKPTDVPIFSDQPAKVRLDLRPDVNADLDPTTLKQGTFEADLPVGGEVTLFAEGVKYKDMLDKKVKVAVSVDGYDRAFLVQTNFDGNPELYSGPFTNVRLSSLAQVPGKPVTVTVEADNIDADATVLSVDRVGNGTFDVIQKYATPRREAVYVKFGGANDAVTLTPVVADWTVEFDTKSVAGRRTFRAQRGPTRDGEATRVLLVDRTAPADVRLIDLPAKDKAVTGTEHVLKAVGLDPESDVAAAYFYVGDAPDADGKPAPGSKVVRGVRLPKDDKAAVADGTWAAKDPIRLPETRGEIKVGVLFVNGVGLTTPAEATLYVRDPDKPKDEKKEEKAKRTTGTIAGTVIQANRLQPDLPVVLTDAAGKAVKKTTTDGAGAFTFKDVPPGEYTVSTVKRADQNAKGSKPVTVEAVEKPATVEIPVKR